MRATGDERVSSIVQVAAATEQETFRMNVERAGGTVRSWLGETNVATVEIEARQLGTLADLPGVVYVETAQKYAP
jgi:hypothetical protein